MKKRVLHLSHCADKGGAARAAYRLHRALLTAGADSTMWVQTKDVEDPTVRPLRTDLLTTLLAQPARIERKLERLAIPGETPFSSDRAIMSALQVSGIEDFDVVHLHFLAHAFDLPAVFGRLRPSQRIVWTMHDANSFTGGCHIFGDCDRYVEECGKCPLLGSSVEADLSRKIHRRKQRLYSGFRIAFIGPSTWISRCCADSSLGRNHEHWVIKHAIDTRTFHPGDRADALTRLQLPKGKLVVSWLAGSVNDRNKGLDLLLGALGKIDPSSVHLLWAGAGDLRLTVPFSHTRLGPISNLPDLLDFYRASDLFAMTSRSETFGMAAVEAASCGTPVIGFSVSGIPEAIGETGLGSLVEPFDTDALAATIEAFVRLTPAEAEEGRAVTREKAVSANDLGDWARRHLEVYDLLTAP